MARIALGLISAILFVCGVSTGAMAESRIALVSDYDAADRVPDGMEVFLVEGDSVSVRDLVDEEVMLALPHVPRHDDESECAGRPMRLPGQEADAGDPTDPQAQSSREA